MLKEFLEGSEPISFLYPSAVEIFKKQFDYLEEHYGKGGIVVPPERQHASLPILSKLCSLISSSMQCVLYSNDSAHSVAEVTNDPAKCCIKDIERSRTDTEKTSIIPVARLPIQMPQYFKGQGFRCDTFCQDS